MDEDLDRCKDLAARARVMARLAYDEDIRTQLSAIAEDYERMAVAIEAKRDLNANQAG